MQICPRNTETERSSVNHIVDIGFNLGFNLAVSFPSDSRGSKARIVLLPSRITRWVYIILHEFIPLHHVILLNVLLYSYELNTLDAGRSRSMCGVIVVDAGMSRSTYHGRDAYIHDHD